MHATHAPSQVQDASHTIGVLCVGGDWACANGDLEALAYVALGLAKHTREPLHRELVALAHTCRSDPDAAAAAWLRLKQRAQHGLA